ncbi:MAG: YlxM family DNA-binding protein [Lachnospiraceae bacterium]|nr:YlxM family DNA-binding protein [Lachnospiraceae bacterium]
MEKIVERGLLYDFYGELLTSHQRSVYEEAVFQDMSLSEIADEFSISRQGVHDIIKRCDKLLNEYEDKLHLVEKFMKIQENAKAINLILDEMSEIGQHDLLMKKCDEIRQLSDGMIEEL